VKSPSKLSFKKAGEYLVRRMSNLSGGGENGERDDGEIFSQADCVDPGDRYYNMQISDTNGKEEIDEKMIAEVTGASTVLKRAPVRRSIFDDGALNNEAMNIFELL